MDRIRTLAGAFPSRYDVPVIARVDTRVFTERYFTRCLDCAFCQDACCQHGVDVDLLHVAAMDRHAEALEAYTGAPRGDWFTDEDELDTELPGGGSKRTRVVDGRCVFHRRGGRGCLLHAYCEEQGMDYHELKSIVDCLFPLTYYDDVLCPALEIDERSLVCMGSGPTLYRGIRDEVRYYFGQGCVDALDRVEAVVGDR